METGEKIALHRKKCGLSQEELAAQLQISRQAVSRWETGDALPNTEKIIALSRLLHVSTDYLLLEDSEFSPAENERPAAAGAEKRDEGEIARRKHLCAVICGTIGVTFFAISLISSNIWMTQNNWFYTTWGPFLTGMLESQGFLFFIPGLILLILSGTLLTREYIYGKK